MHCHLPAITKQESMHSPLPPPLLHQSGITYWFMNIITHFDRTLGNKWVIWTSTVVALIMVGKGEMSLKLAFGERELSSACAICWAGHGSGAWKVTETVPCFRILRESSRRVQDKAGISGRKGMRKVKKKTHQGNLERMRTLLLATMACLHSNSMLYSCSSWQKALLKKKSL